VTYAENLYTACKLAVQPSDRRETGSAGPLAVPPWGEAPKALGVAIYRAMNHSANASTTVPTVKAASTSFHFCTGTLPMVSPVRPLTAM